MVIQRSVYNVMISQLLSWPNIRSLIYISDVEKRNIVGLTKWNPKYEKSPNKRMGFFFEFPTILLCSIIHLVFIWIWYVKH